MNEQLMRDWVAALRSGQYKQCKKQLSRGYSSYCCLGVLSHIIKNNYEYRREYVTRQGMDIGRDERSDLIYYPSTGEGALRRNLIPNDVWNAIGMNFSQILLADMNDNGRTFESIADYIERRAA